MKGNETTRQIYQLKLCSLIVEPPQKIKGKPIIKWACGYKWAITPVLLGPKHGNLSCRVPSFNTPRVLKQIKSCGVFYANFLSHFVNLYNGFTGALEKKEGPWAIRSSLQHVPLIRVETAVICFRIYGGRKLGVGLSFSTVVRFSLRVQFSRWRKDNYTVQLTRHAKKKVT